MKRQVFLGLAVSLACLAYALAKVDFARLWEQTLKVNPLYFLAVTALLGLAFWVRSVRWRILLAPMGHCRLGPLYSATLMGFMANNVLPTRLGEFVRAYAISRLEEVPAAGALATLVVERVLDGLTLLLVLFGGLLLTDPLARAGSFNVDYLRTAGYALLAAYAGVLAFMAALWRWPGAVTGLFSALAGRLSPNWGPKTAELLKHFTGGLAVLGHGKKLVSLLLLSFGLWSVYAVLFTVFLPAVGLPLSLFLGIMALAGAGLAGVVPAGPGYVGTMQLAVAWTLSMAGTRLDQALAYSFIFWAAQYFPVTLAGLIEMWRQGMSLASLQKR